MTHQFGEDHLSVFRTGMFVGHAAIVTGGGRPPQPAALAARADCNCNCRLHSLTGSAPAEAAPQRPPHSPPTQGGAAKVIYLLTALGALRTRTTRR